VKLQVTGHKELIEKEDILAWEKEYRHLQWGCAGSISHITEMLPPGSKVLDVGCGCGRHLFPLSACYSTTGMDISSRALHRAREYLKKQDRKADYATQVLLTCPLREKLSMPWSVWEYCSISLKQLGDVAVSEIRRVLKYNGLVS
jgi:ubiquinone/menaquinone biosynthesis C-methylase UbiE